MTCSPVVKPSQNAARIALEDGALHLVWRNDDLSGLLATAGRNDDPVAHLELITSWAEVVDTARITKPDADHAFCRRRIMRSDDRIVVATATLPYLFSRLETALESRSRSRPRLVERGWRIPRFIQVT
jgi:hypothetical protein